MQFLSFFTTFIGKKYGLRTMAPFFIFFPEKGLTSSNDVVAVKSVSKKTMPFSCKGSFCSMRTMHRFGVSSVKAFSMQRQMESEVPKYCTFLNTEDTSSIASF